MIESVSKLRGDRLILFVCILTGVICPGFLFFYLFDPSTFAALDFGKLLMLAACVTLPAFLPNFGGALLFLSLNGSGPSAKSISSALPDDVENRENIIDGWRAAERRQWRRHVDMALTLGSVVNFFPFYIAFAISPFWLATPRGAAVFIAFAEVATLAVGGFLGMRLVQGPTTGDRQS